eukprot:3216910-Pyramimonas_sp.AAC.1
MAPRKCQSSAVSRHPGAFEAHTIRSLHLHQEPGSAYLSYFRVPQGEWRCGCPTKGHLWGLVRAS